MNKTLLLSILITGLFLSGITFRNPGLLVLTLPLMVYMAAGLIFQPAEPRLSLTRQLSGGRAEPNEPVEVTLTITNNGSSLQTIEVIDLVPAGLAVLEGNTATPAALAPGRTITLNYTVSGERGVYRFDPVQVTTIEVTGLFKRQTNLSAPNRVAIMPRVTPVRRIAIRPPRTGIYAGLIPARQGGPGVEFFGVREYQPGDPTRWINARASARFRQQIFVNEFEQERVVDVGLILDARQQSDARRGGESLFEYSIQATATLADTFINGGNRVGLFIYGRFLDWTFPGYGKLQRERILQALARTKQGSGKVFEKLEYLPTQLFPVRSQLVLISPLMAQDPDMLIKLRARGYRLLVISPDPISFEQASYKQNRAVALAARLARLERNLILKKLRQAEIQVVDWPVSTPFHQVALRALSQLPGRGIL